MFGDLGSLLGDKTLQEFVNDILVGLTFLPLQQVLTFAGNLLWVTLNPLAFFSNYL